MVKNAVFAMGDKIYQTSIINNQCNIPSEILSDVGEVFFGVYAYKVNDGQLELRYSPFPTRFTIISGSYNPTAEESQEITSSQFEQYMQAMNDGLNKVEESLTKMDEATSSANDLVDDINQKLENGDFIGPQGPQGVQGTPGKDGINGADGVGITTITSGQSTVEEDKTITPVTVQKTDGSSQIFKVEAKNGQDGKDGLNGKDGVNGQNGQDGITPTIGANGNWYLGDTDTGKPSRGEVGPSPDLTDYVKNTDYATSTKAGVVKSHINGFQVSENGNPNAAILSKEQYDTIENQYFISKGTLENIKNDYVGSSTPVQDLTSTVTNIQDDQDESKPKNTASGEIVSVDDAIAYKTFEVKVDGASEQETTTGKNKLQITTFNDGTKSKTLNGVTANINENGTISLSGTASAKTQFYLTKNDFSLESGDGYFWCNSPSVNCRFEFVASINGEEKYLNSYSTTPNTFNITSSFVYSGSTIIVASGTSTNVTLTPMISNGTFTEYEPYTGGQPSPSPDFPQEITTLTFDKITRCGKNLYELRDYERTVIGMNLKIENQILSIDGTSSNTWFSIGNVSNQNNIPRLKKDEDYTVTFISTFNKDLNCTLWNDVGNVIIQGVQCNPVKANSKSSFTFKCSYDEILTNFRIAFAGFTVGEAVQGTMQIMIEPGTQATEYEPYQATEYAIDLQGNEMVEIPNGVKDELVIDKYGNVNLIKNVGKIILDGSEDWTCTNNKVYTLLADINLPWCDVTDVPNIISDMFITDKNGNTFSRNNIISTYIPTQQYNYQKLVISKYDFNGDVDMFKSFLSTHNVIVYYQLATPQPISLGKLSDIITTLNGTNNISINGNIPTTISTTYALDIKKYIDNKLAEVSSALIEEG